MFWKDQILFFEVSNKTRMSLTAFFCAYYVTLLGVFSCNLKCSINLKYKKQYLSFNRLLQWFAKTITYNVTHSVTDNLRPGRHFLSITELFWMSFKLSTHSVVLVWAVIFQYLTKQSFLQLIKKNLEQYRECLRKNGKNSITWSRLQPNRLST